MHSFFFSSRRRHTRCGRDWSSDVCSSDLGHVERAAPRRHDGLHDLSHGGDRPAAPRLPDEARSEEHTSELQSRPHLVCRLLLEKKKQTKKSTRHTTTYHTCQYDTHPALPL